MVDMGEGGGDGHDFEYGTPIICIIILIILFTNLDW